MNDNDYTITLDTGETLDLEGLVYNLNDSNTITVDVNNIDGGVDYIKNFGDGTFTIDDTINVDFSNWVTESISINEIERMCKEYPSLDKVWRNFKAVYDLVKQDYEGKLKAGELDDDIPF